MTDYGCVPSNRPTAAAAVNIMVNKLVPLCICNVDAVNAQLIDVDYFTYVCELLAAVSWE